MEHLLEVKNLEVEFSTYAGMVKAVRGVSFEVDPGEVVALVGESGCGKSVTAQSILQLIPSPPGKITNGEIIFNGDNILNKNEREMQKIRGNSIGMIFRSDDLPEPGFIHCHRLQNLRLQGHDPGTGHEGAVVSFHWSAYRNRKYAETIPHQFSGGMRQRVFIPALACEPNDYCRRARTLSM